jgi:hypothetical protein
VTEAAVLCDVLQNAKVSARSKKRREAVKSSVGRYCNQSINQSIQSRHSEAVKSRACVIPFNASRVLYKGRDPSRGPELTYW